MMQTPPIGTLFIINSVLALSKKSKLAAVGHQRLSELLVCSFTTETLARFNHLPLPKYSLFRIQSMLRVYFHNEFNGLLESCTFHGTSKNLKLLTHAETTLIFLIVLVEGSATKSLKLLIIQITSLLHFTKSLHWSHCRLLL